MDNFLKERVRSSGEKYVQLRTKGVFRPVTKQIGNSIADIKDYFKERSKDGVTVVPSDIPPHLNDVKETLLRHLNPDSFFFKKNLVTGNDVSKLETSTERLLVLMDSLAFAMAFKVKSRPCNVICDVLLAVCNQPVFVLTIVDGNPDDDDYSREYNISVARGVTGKLKLFMDERICVVYGVCCKNDIANAETFCEALKKQAHISSIFIPQKTFETSLPKFNSILTAFWAGVAETNSVTTDHEKKDEDVKRFLTKDQCVLLLENINKREVTVQHKPRSGASVLMLEVASRLSSLNKIRFACSSHEEQERLSSVYPNIQFDKDLTTFVPETVRKQQRLWKFVKHSDTSSPGGSGCSSVYEGGSSVVLVSGEVFEQENEATIGIKPLHSDTSESDLPKTRPMDYNFGGSKRHRRKDDSGYGKKNDDIQYTFSTSTRGSCEDSITTTDCKTCKNVSKHGEHGRKDVFTIHIERSHFDKAKSHNKKKKFLKELEKHVSALMNTSGGNILIHVKGQQKEDRNLQFFDECINHAFDDNYKRRWLEKDDLEDHLQDYHEILKLKVSKHKHKTDTFK